MFNFACVTYLILKLHRTVSREKMTTRLISPGQPWFLSVVLGVIIKSISDTLE